VDICWVKSWRATYLACNKAVQRPYFTQQSSKAGDGIAYNTIQRDGPNSADRCWLADFLSRLQRDDLAPATLRGYRYDLRQFLRWCDRAKGPARFEKLSALDLIN
jgi:hypothetical protein